MVTRVLQASFFGLLFFFGLWPVWNSLEKVRAMIPGLAQTEALGFGGLPAVLLLEAIMPVAMLLYLALMAFLGFSYFVAWDDDE